MTPPNGLADSIAPVWKTPVTRSSETSAYVITRSLFSRTPGSCGCEGAADVPREKEMTNESVTVRFVPNDKGNPPGKLADAELHFNEGSLQGLKLIGFAIWERRGAGGRNVTFPARQYSVNGERRSFAMLRPIVDTQAQNRIRDFILEAFAHYEEQLAEVS
jgi:hypothetical protein